MPLVIASNEPRETLIRQLNAEGYQIVGEQSLPGEQAAEETVATAADKAAEEAESGGGLVDEAGLQEAPVDEQEEPETEDSAVSERGEQKWRGRGRKPGWKARQRINQLVAQRKELEERLARIEKMIEQALTAKSQPAESTTTKPEAEKPPVAEPGAGQEKEPDPADFDNYESYLKALAEWQANRVMRSAVRAELERIHKQLEEFEEARNRERIAEEWHATLSEYGGVDNETLKRAEQIALHPLVSEHLLRLGPKEGPLVALYLARHPDEAEKVNRLAEVPEDADPDQIVEASTSVAMALGRISALASSEFPSARTAKTANVAVSKAPRPITPVRGTSTRNQVDPDSMTFDEFVKWREQGGNWP